MWKEVIAFWFEETSPRQWFMKDAAFDALVRERFEPVYWRIVKGETESWRTAPEGRLAEIIVLDQLARNMFRDTPQAFAEDPLALRLAQEAIAAGADRQLSAAKRRFLYMPYMHSESRAVHRKAIWIFLTLPIAQWGTALYEWKHKRIIDRFGRYPHRNAAIGRASTPEEIEFMKTNKGF